MKLQRHRTLDFSSVAIFSDDDSYRYQLMRVWKPFSGIATFVMLNPSTADAFVNDPTVTRCIGFAQRWGYGAVRILNLYALRSTNPGALRSHADPIGPDNDDIIRRAAHENSGYPVICAWGANVMGDRGVAVVEMFRLAGRLLYALGFTKDGIPRHPLYLRSDATMIDMPTVAAVAPSEGEP